MLSVSLQRKYNFYHQNTLLDAFRMNSRDIIGRNPSMVIPLLANQDLTPMLVSLSYGTDQLGQWLSNENVKRCPELRVNCTVISHELVAVLETIFSQFQYNSLL